MYGESPTACGNCGRDVASADRYCPWCGEPQRPSDGPDDTGATGPGAGPDASGEELRALRASVNAMTAELARVSLRLEVLEGERATPRRTPADATTAAPPSQPQSAASREAVFAPSRERRPPSASARPAQPLPARTGGGIGAPRLPLPDFASWNWEWLVGGNWLARIGVVALIFGVAFFISLAIDRGWLGEVERVALGLVGGLALLGAGEYWRRRYAVWAQTVTGGGLAILYLSVYGAFALYALISPMTAFGAFSLITLAGAILSLRHESAAVAVFSIIGGFATPLLLQERLPDQRLLLAYVLVLDVGVLALAGFRNWRWLTLLALVGSLFLFGFWQQELEPSTGLAQIGITAIFLIFAGATVAFHVVRKQASGSIDLALITLNAAAFYGISYFLIYDEHRPWMGGFTASLAAFYALLAAGCRMRGEAQLNLTLFSAGLAVLFTVLAVPVQLGGPWISIAWGIEGLVLIWLSFPLRMRELRWAGYAMFAVSAVWLLAVDTPGALADDFTPFLNEYTLSYAAAIVLPALAGWLLHLRREALESWERFAIPALALRSAAFAAVPVPVQLDGAWVTVAWAAESLAFLALSRRLGMAEMRWFAYGLLAAMLVRLFGLDTFDVDLETFRPVLNWRFLAFASAIAALYAAAVLELRRVVAENSTTETTERAVSLPALLALANLATLWLLSAEIIASADSALFNLPANVSENVTGLGLSLLWGVYAAALVVLGVTRRWRWVRLAGLALLAVPVVKLFAFDSRLLEQEYRVIAFLALGLILVAGGLLYQRYSRVVRGFLFEQ